MIMPQGQQPPTAPGAPPQQPAYPQQPQPPAYDPAAQQQQYGQPQAAPQQQYGQPQQPAYPQQAQPGYDPAQYGQAPGAPQQQYGQAPGAPPQQYGQQPQQGGYPQQPGQPQQPGSGISGPSFGGLGVGPGGRLRVGFHMGDFSPTNLFSAVVSGKGFPKPRIMGLMMMGLSVAIFVVNTLLIMVAHIYFPYFYGLVPILWWGGIFMAITGQPQTRDDGGLAPMWSRIGLGAALAFGVLGGLVMVFVNWEPWG